MQGWTWLPGLKLGTKPNLFMLDMLDARHVRMRAVPCLLAIFCLLVRCPCSHSLESCKNSEIEPEETSSLVTHLARQFRTNVSTEGEALPSQIPRKCFAVFIHSFVFVVLVRGGRPEGFANLAYYGFVKSKLAKVALHLQDQSVQS